MRHLVVNYLEERNIKVASASGREEMARCFESDEPDLVTLDLRLGQDDGLDLMRRASVAIRYPCHHYHRSSSR